MNPYLTNKQKYHALGTSNNTFVAKRGVIIGIGSNYLLNIAFYQDGEDDNQPGAVQVPMGSLWVGNQWGMCFLPEAGTEVLVVFTNGDLALPVGVCLLFNNEQQPISDINPGEGIIKHKSGSLLKFTNDGNVTLIANNDLNVQATNTINLNAKNINLTAQQKITLTAGTEIDNVAPIVNASQNMSVTGNFNANNGETTMNDGVFSTHTLEASNDVTAAGISLKSHTHAGVTRGGESTDPPTG